MELSATMLLPCSLEAEWPKLCNCLKIGFQEMVADRFGTKIETLQENVHQNRVQKFPVEFLRIPREGEAKVWNCLQTCCCHVDWKLKGPKCGAVCKNWIAMLLPCCLGGRAQSVELSATMLLPCCLGGEGPQCGTACNHVVAMLIGS